MSDVIIEKKRSTGIFAPPRPTELPSSAPATGAPSAAEARPEAWAERGATASIFDAEPKATVLGDTVKASGKTAAALAEGLGVQAKAYEEKKAAEALTAKNEPRRNAMGARLKAAGLSDKDTDEILSRLAAQSGKKLERSLDELDAAIAKKDTDALRGIARRSRIDRFMDDSAATYDVDGKKVRAKPHFRMSTGMNGTPTECFKKMQGGVKKELWTSELALAADRVSAGRGTPEDVRKVTDALIKSGKLKEVKAAHPGLSDEDAIRQLQWDYGIGMDCAAYAMQAMYAADGGQQGDYGLNKDIKNENLGGVKTNKSFSKVKPKDAQPGDLLLLDAVKPGEVGHATLVRSRRELSSAEIGELTEPKPPAGEDGFVLKGQTKGIHVFELDSSWGAGPSGDKSGGVGRRKFLYNEQTGRWASYDPQRTPEVVPSKLDGPYDHPYDGIYRPKVK